MKISDERMLQRSARTPSASHRLPLVSTSAPPHPAVCLCRCLSRRGGRCLHERTKHHFTGTPPRPATWTGPRSPIRSDAIKERTSFDSR